MLQKHIKDGETFVLLFIHVLHTIHWFHLYNVAITDADQSQRTIKRLVCILCSNSLVCYDLLGILFELDYVGI